MSELDTAAVRDTISRYGRFRDGRDRDGLGSILADAIELDFTSLSGGEPEMVTGPDLVGRWLPPGPARAHGPAIGCAT